MAVKISEEVARAAPSPAAISDGELTLGNAVRTADRLMQDAIGRLAGPNSADHFTAASRSLANAADAAAELLREQPPNPIELKGSPLPIP